MSASPSTSQGPPRWIVLDDLDASINYEGDSWFTASDAKANFETWNNAGFGLTYLGSLHGTNSDAKMSFTFDGSAVVFSGSNNPLNESGIVTPAYQCFLDGVEFGEQTTFPFPANNWEFCNWADKDGAGATHTLSVEIKTDGQTFYADMIKYVPTPDSKAAREIGGGEGQENVVEIPRGDLAIKFGDGWGSLGDTANSTTRRGATAEIEFYGTRLSWWSFIPGEFPKAATTGTYTIDDGRPTSFTLAGLQPDDPTTYHQMIFQTPSLSRGPHKMVVTYQGGGSVTPLALTHVLVSNGNATAPRRGDPSVFELATMTSAVPSPTGSGDSKPPDGGNSSSSSSKSNIGAIVGGVMGGLVLIGATIAILFFSKRRNRRRRDRDSMPNVVTPFSPQQNSRPLMEEMHSNDDHPHHQQGPLMYDGSLGYGSNTGYGANAQYGAANTATLPSNYSKANASSSNSGMGHRAGQASTSEVSSSGYGSSAPHTGLVGGAAAMGGAAPAAGFAPRRKGDPVPPPTNPRVLVHQDSGVRMNQAPEEPVEELPPMYTAQ